MAYLGRNATSGYVYVHSVEAVLEQRDEEVGTP